MEAITPKEKAKELVEKFIPVSFGDKKSTAHVYAKKCAIICCETILKCPLESEMNEDGSWTNPQQFWNAVKNEIEKF